MAIASGATFAGYTVARRLGTGVTGEVYLVQDARSARWRALKILLPTMSSDGEFRRRFHSETYVATHLYHPHIAEVNDRGEFDGQLWVAMDYVDGINAAQLIAQRFPAVSPVGEVLAIITAVADALDFAHQRGLLHRDVKPANILLTSRGGGEQRVLLADFGIARQLSGPTGDIGYTAPEQLMGADVDGRADQYALAATAFHLLTGAPPVTQPLDDAPPKLSDQRPELMAIDDVFGKALAGNPADRFESCSEFAAAANEAAGISIGDGSPEAVLAGEAVDYPAFVWPELEELINNHSCPDYPANGGRPERRGTARHSAAGALAPRLDDFGTGSAAPATPPAPPAAAAAPHRRKWGTVLPIAVAVVLLGGLLAVGIVIGYGAEPANRAGSPSTSAAAGAPAPTTAPPAAPVPPVPLQGSYRVEIQRAKQTVNYVPDPQPPNVETWWAFRSSCAPTECTANGTLLDDDDHTQAKSTDEDRLVMKFAEGQWQSAPETVLFPCTGSNGATQKHTTTQVLSLRPQPQGDLVGEMTITVRTNECGQRGAVIRIPAVATRIGQVPPGVDVPDPATGTNSPPAEPTTAASGPGR